jgi:hypothetical protein
MSVHSTFISPYIAFELHLNDEGCWIGDGYPSQRRTWPIIILKYQRISFNKDANHGALTKYKQENITILCANTTHVQTFSTEVLTKFKMSKMIQNVLIINQKQEK